MTRWRENFNSATAEHRVLLFLNLSQHRVTVASWCRLIGISASFNNTNTPLRLSFFKAPALCHHATQATNKVPSCRKSALWEHVLHQVMMCHCPSLLVSWLKYCIIAGTSYCPLKTCEFVPCG
jgi:hypothetical protein